jgi:hypothetical protein
LESGKKGMKQGAKSEEQNSITKAPQWNMMNPFTPVEWGTKNHFTGQGRRKLENTKVEP